MIRNQFSSLHTAAVVGLLATGGTLVATGLGHTTGRPAADVRDRAAVRNAVRRQPILFERNVGQIRTGSRFIARGQGVAMQFSEGAAFTAVYAADRQPRNPLAATRGRTVQREVIRQQFVGANPKANIVAELPTGTKHNYFLGADPKRWKRNVETFAQVRYEDLYPGIDLVYHGAQGVFEYDFHVKPGADPALVTMQFDKARKLSLSEKGELRIGLSGGASYVHGKPVLYQDIRGQRVEVDGEFALLADNQVGFSVFGYNPDYELVIDPPVAGYSTYLGGGPYDDQVADMVADGSGNVYVTGDAGSPDFPTTAGAYDTALAGFTDLFVTKITPPTGVTSAKIGWSTFVGGPGMEVFAAEPLMSIARDSTGRLGVVGGTETSGFPLVSAVDGVFAGTREGIAFLLNATGDSLLFSTYLGGTGSDELFDCKFDSLNNFHVVGRTASTDFPTVNAYDSTSNGNDDVVVAKINAPASAPVLAYSTYYGGSSVEAGWALDLYENGGTVYDCIVGYTYSTDLPTFRHILAADGHPVQNTLAVPGGSGGFMARFAPPVGMGTMSLDAATYFSQASNQRIHDIVVTANQGGDVVFCGYTDNAILYTGDPRDHTGFQTSSNGGQDGFIAQVDLPDVGTGVGNASTMFCSFIGGGQTETAHALARDVSSGTGLANERFWMVGYTDSSSAFNVAPETPGSFPAVGTVLFNKKQGSVDAFVARVYPGGDGATTLEECGYYGGNLDDRANAVAVNPNDPGCPFIGGSTGGGTFPIYNGPQPNFGGGTSKDGFVAQLCGTGTLALYKVDVTQVTTTTARVSWQTNRPATTKVNYGTTTSYGSSQSASPDTPTMNHFLTLTGLSPSTLYHIQAESTDGSTTVTSSDVLFITCPVAPKLTMTVVTSSFFYIQNFQGGPKPDFFAFNYNLANNGYASASNVVLLTNALTALGTGKSAESSIPNTHKPHNIGTIAMGGSHTQQKAYFLPSSYRGKSATFRTTGTFTGGSWASTVRMTIP